ncbi:MAG TPA: NAD(P)-dependent oxidoreductase, partial [Clostridia bacterium]|nr:NAD(P)-dependent oxidoreductase [Clostridia bacterium]
GHWCPEELPWPWNYDVEAKVNPFFAQVWYPLHDKDENNYYDESIFKGMEDF